MGRQGQGKSRERRDEETITETRTEAGTVTWIVTGSDKGTETEIRMKTDAKSKRGTGKVPATGRKT